MVSDGDREEVARGRTSRARFLNCSGSRYCLYLDMTLTTIAEKRFMTFLSFAAAALLFALAFLAFSSSSRSWTALAAFAAASAWTLAMMELTSGASGATLTGVAACVGGSRVPSPV